MRNVRPRNVKPRSWLVYDRYRNERERERGRGSFRLEEEAAEFGSGLAERPAGRDVVAL